MAAVRTVQEYEAFRAESAQLISYLMNIETMPLDKALQGTVEAAKDAYRQIRDDIPREMSGAGSAQDLKPTLEQAKKQYMQHYYQQHNAHRLGMKQGAKKGELVSGNVPQI